MRPAADLGEFVEFSTYAGLFQRGGDRQERGRQCRLATHPGFLEHPVEVRSRGVDCDAKLLGGRDQIVAADDFSASRA